jgi:hypothetical protein
MLDRTNAARKPGESLVQRDRRADAGERRVQVTGSDILISRRLAGISMMIAVPIKAYRGVALAVEPAASGGASYRLSLAHRDPDLDVILAETRDGGAVAADWKYWASFLDLPRLSGKDGAVEPLQGPPAGAPAKDMRARRRNAGVAKRRTRFARRRKQGDLARADAVFSGEREIVCYE